MLTIGKMTPELLQKRLSHNIKKTRKTLGLSQERLAEQAQLSIQMVNDIEGLRRWPSEKTLSKLANALKTDVYTLFLPEDSAEQATPFQKQTVASDLQKIFAESVERYLSDGK